jgi:hypothetical protein
MFGTSWDDPKTMAALQLAGGLLGGQGNTMQRLAGGLNAYGATLGAAKRAQQEEEERRAIMAQRALQLRELEGRMADAARAREEAAAAKQARGSFLDSIDPNAGPAMPVSIPQAMRAGLGLQEIQALMPAKAENPFGKVDPKDFTPESVRRFAATNNYSDLVPRTRVEFVDGRAVDPFATQPGTVIPQRAPASNPFTDLLVPGPGGQLVPNKPLIDARKDIGAASASRFNVNTGDNKFEAKAAEVLATQLSDTYKQGQAATRTLGQVNRLDDLLKKTGGGFTPAFKMYAGQFGINTSGLDDIQAAEAVIQSLIPQQRPPGSGTMSDRDVELFRQSLPRLINQPGGNKKIVGTMRGIAEYDRKLGQISSDALTGKITREKAVELMNALPNPLADFTGGEDIHSQAEAIIRGAVNGKR